MNQYTISTDLILSVIKTLKEIDVRGYDSMNRLVGLVILFEQILNTPAEPQTEDNPINEE